MQQDDVGYFIRCPECGAAYYPPQALCYPKRSYPASLLAALTAPCASIETRAAAEGKPA